MYELLAEWVYDTLQGVLMDEARLPGVENLFEEGSECMNCYEKALNAYERICERLHVGDEDRDLEEIFNAFIDIQRVVGLKMYEYGSKYGNRKR